jgi:aminoglycoside phosphotransferase (APT) family kinase protein
MQVRDRLVRAGLAVGGELEPAVTMASPSWWGADSERFRLPSGRFVKAMAPHASGYIDIPAAFVAARLAGDAGIGPRVLAADPEQGVLVLDDLTELAATATLDLFDDPDRAERLVALRKAVHALPAFPRRATVFDDVRAAHRLALDAGATLPDDFAWIARLLGTAEQRIKAAGYDAVPCHGDGNVSNVLVLADGALRLVDWDCAAVMDPLQDLGVLLHEIRPFDIDARAVFEMYWGSWDDSLFDRCRVYGIADSVRWGLIGLYADVCSPGTHEYVKFSDWQFVRARAGLRDPHFDDRVRNL